VSDFEFRQYYKPDKLTYEDRQRLEPSGGIGDFEGL
jgi:hypothetical protein